VTPTADFDRIFGSASFLSEPVVVIAVSGGSDSTALLFRTKEKVSPATRLVAVTVDHALRQESAGEAAAVAALCARREVEHRTLRWDGDKPATGLMAAARLARYALLAKAATDLGGRVVLTGHTADDQAETIAMRMQRGEGMGLAGIAPFTLHERKVWFARPLLGERRATLRDDLRRRGIGWIDDPSNKNETFERVRVRRDLSGRTGEDSDRLIEISARAAAERTEVGHRAATVIARHAQLCAENTPTPNPSPQGGWVRGGGKIIQSAGSTGIGLDPAFLTEDSDAAIHALRIMLAVVGGTEQLPDLDESELSQSGALGDHRRVADRAVQPVPDAAAAWRGRARSPIRSSCRKSTSGRVKSVTIAGDRITGTYSDNSSGLPDLFAGRPDAGAAA
jgi:tRNA(Ile)-lysidine synthase